MALMFGRFDIQSELSQSDTAVIYKAVDAETNQVVALKTQSLEPLGDRADAFVDTLIAEGESTRDLASRILSSSTAPARSTASSVPRWSTSKATALPPCWPARRLLHLGSVDITPPGCSGLEQGRLEGCGSPFIGTGQDHGAVGRMVKILGYGHLLTWA